MERRRHKNFRNLNKMQAAIKNSCMFSGIVVFCLISQKNIYKSRNLCYSIQDDVQKDISAVAYQVTAGQPLLRIRMTPAVS